MIATFHRCGHRVTLSPEAKRMKPTVVHGAARGADVMAALLALRWGWNIEAHPGADPHDLVALGADVCLAFPISKSLSVRECVRLAKAAGIPVVVCEGRLAMPVPRKGEQR